MFYRGVLAAAVAVFACVPAMGAIQNYSYSATITDGADAGTQLTGYFAFDDAAASVDDYDFQGGHVADYNALTFFSASSAHFFYRFDEPPKGTVDIQNNTRDGARDVFSTYTDKGFATAAPGIFRADASFNLFDYSNRSFTDTSLPSNVALPFWTEKTLFFSSVDRSISFGLSANIDSIEAIPYIPGVPEPATWALMIAGFGLVGAAARRRQLQAATL